MKVSKIVDSRDNWKGKAKSRGSTVRSLRKTSKAHKAQRVCDQERITRLESEITQLRTQLHDHEHGLSVERDASIQHRTLCVLIVLRAIVSFRSVPRILEVFEPLLRIKMPMPHFTSVINWTLRAGIAIFKQVSLISEPWVAIIDCSIDIGTRKALVVLRVLLSALESKQGAIGPRDCQCIGLEVTHQWNGQLVSEALGRIFAKAGMPKAIIKDGGSDLNKGVRLFCEQRSDHTIYTIDDIGHFAANGLKALFAKSKSFIKFIEITTLAAARIRQTNLAWLLPPKIRTKGRFQGITELATWAQKILTLTGGQDKAKNNSDLKKARGAFTGLAKLRPFLHRFCQTCSITELFLKLMKTHGLNEATYLAGKDILAKLPQRSLVRIRLSTWLEKHITIHRHLAIAQRPLLVSSDAIESLFGLFKTIVQRNPQAELNRSIYLLPLLCGNRSYIEIDQSLKSCSHTQMLSQVEQTVPPTLRQQRTQQFKKCSTLVPKSGNFQRLETG